MKARDENVVSSFSAVDNVFAKYVTVWTPVVALAAGVARFRVGFDRIKAHIQAQSSSTKGVTLDKRTALDEMIAPALVVAGGVYAYAFDQSDAELQAKVDYSETDLRRIRDGEIGPVCQGIHDLANGLVAHLGDYGVDAALLTELADKIEAYGGSTGKPRVATGLKKVAGRSLGEEIASTRQVLEAKVDKLAAKFKLTQPDFFNEYVAARVIVDNPGGRKPKNGNGNGNGHQPPVTPT